MGTRTPRGAPTVGLFLVLCLLPAVAPAAAEAGNKAAAGNKATAGSNAETDKGLPIFSVLRPSTHTAAPAPTATGTAAEATLPTASTSGTGDTGKAVSSSSSGAAASSNAWLPSVTRPTAIPSPSPVPLPSSNTLPSSSSNTTTAAAGTEESAIKPSSPAAATPTPAPAPKSVSVTANVSGSSTATAVAGSSTSGTLNATQKIWKPKYPFPQCINTTLSYDVSFVGKLQYIQVGSVRYAYHKFGPLRPNVQPVIPSTVFSLKVKPPAPVVFISGWGLSMYIWPIPLLQRLAESREVVIFDNMRTGLSTDNSTTPLSIALMANSTAALITKLGLQQPDVWSWSLGAFVGYGLLAFHPNKVGNVIIAAGSPGGPDALLPPRVVTDDIGIIEQNYTALLPYLFPDGAKDDGVCSFYAAYNSFYASQFTALATPLGKESLEEQSLAVVKFFTDSTIINKLEGTPNRVLILHGVQDKLMPVGNALLGAWRLLGAWMLQFPGEGHGIPFSNLPAVIATTLQFFSFANPLSRAEMNEWANYGGTASSRIVGDNVTLVVRAEASDDR